ncbi:hypothetical protein UFOVP48_12 [uncultured Caudovirales phage]|uniref:Uncharacterized protein n=1 Tax=uncultured Caudovirales phage TaxID=2100421 RepID=A0A6J5KMD5_9CAUD|nr:hypothetical protein UFOVP48_12 [uncultured Caudovirales phage]
MLIIEKNSNGRTMVTLKKDWWPGRISAGWMPPQRNFMTTEEDYHTQHTLLKNRKVTEASCST